MPPQLHKDGREFVCIDPLFFAPAQRTSAMLNSSFPSSSRPRFAFRPVAAHLKPLAFLRSAAIAAVALAAAIFEHDAGILRLHVTVDDHRPALLVAARGDRGRMSLSAGTAGLSNPGTPSRHQLGSALLRDWRGKSLDDPSPATLSATTSATCCVTRLSPSSFFLF